MTRPLFRSAIVSFIALIIILVVAGNIFEFNIRRKSVDPKSDTQVPVTHNAQDKAPLNGQTPAGNPAIGQQLPSSLPVLPGSLLPKIPPTPEQFYVSHGDLMTDIGIPDHLKDKAVDVLKSHDAEMKQQMEAALRAQAPPSPQVFKDMKERRDQLLREILGESQYHLYSQNVDTIPERAAISRVQSRLESAGMALSKDQSVKIFQAMVDGARSPSPTVNDGATLKPKGRAGAADNRFQKAAGALREASSELSEAQQAEINQFIDDTNRMRARMKR